MKETIRVMAVKDAIKEIKEVLKTAPEITKPALYAAIEGLKDSIKWVTENWQNLQTSLMIWNLFSMVLQCLQQSLKMHWKNWTNFMKKIMIENKHKVNVAVRNETYKHLQELKKEEGRTITELISRAVKDYIINQKKNRLLWKERLTA